MQAGGLAALTSFAGWRERLRLSPGRRLATIERDRNIIAKIRGEIRSVPPRVSVRKISQIGPGTGFVQ